MPKSKTWDEVESRLLSFDAKDMYKLFGMVGSPKISRTIDAMQQNQTLDSCYRHVTHSTIIFFPTWNEDPQIHIDFPCEHSCGNDLDSLTVTLYETRTNQTVEQSKYPTANVDGLVAHVEKYILKYQDEVNRNHLVES